MNDTEPDLRNTETWRSRSIKTAGNEKINAQEIMIIIESNRTWLMDRERDPEKCWQI